ncbi:MAG TPA: CaiB/BaiF CoA-transferase family protein [Burkholderiales bacterium]|nr:CaiB/BaiF CoA-transferase family protein [Burkholderiales bacterium]
MPGVDGWQPLAGIRVVDFSMFVPGPFASAILADLGAEVIKVESPAGDPARGYIPVQFRTENRNKRSLAINLKAPESRDVVERLAKHADIVLEGFRPGVARRLGIDYDALSAANPRLVYCSISGYGQSGPWRERPGHDVNYVAAAGGLAFPGQWLSAPSRSSLPLADMSGGSFAATAVLAALHERGRTGRGVQLDLSLFEAAFFWAAMRHGLSPGVDPRAHIFPVNDIFECADGRRLTLGILEEHFWNNFVRCVAGLAPELSGEDYATDARRRVNGDRLSARLAEVLKQKSAAEWVQLLEANDVPVDLCLTPAEAAELPQLAERGDVVELRGERFAPFPVHAGARRGGSIRRAPPGAGEHSREILVELGFDDAAIADLVRAGAVKAG